MLRVAYTDVTTSGVHLSAAIESVFRFLSPDAELGQRLRTTLFQAVRYGDISRALSGKLDGVVDAEEMFCPGWLRSAIEQSLGETTRHFLECSLADAPATIRVNTLKTTTKPLLKALSVHTPTLINSESISIGKPFGLFRTQAFADGWFEQQDVTSMRVCHALNVSKGMRVIDACAGNGGKTLHLAALMQNKGTIIALDTSEQKLSVLRHRMARAGAFIIETRHVNSTKVVKRIAGTADRVLIDAPCTGTGVLRRNPDILWHLTQESFTELQRIQADILRRNALIAKPGGLVVYATCSVLREECEEQVLAFLQQHNMFALESEWRTMPGDHGGDGFYVAVLKRSALA